MSFRFLNLFAFALFAAALTACPKNTKRTKIITAIPEDLSFDEKTLASASEEDKNAFLALANELQGLTSPEDSLFLSIHNYGNDRYQPVTKTAASNASVGKVVADLQRDCYRRPSTEWSTTFNDLSGSTERIRFEDSLQGVRCPAQVGKNQTLTVRVLQHREGLYVTYGFANLKAAGNYFSPTHRQLLGFSTFNRETSWQVRTEQRSDGRYQYSEGQSSGTIHLLNRGPAEFQISKKILEKPDGTRKSIAALLLKTGGRTYSLTVIDEGRKLYLGSTELSAQLSSSLDLFRAINMERDEIVGRSSLMRPRSMQRSPEKVPGTYE